MVAYAALVSLLQILDTILHPAATECPIYNTDQLRSLHEKVSFLLDFLESSSSYHGKRKYPGLDSLETKIGRAAYKAKDAIESGISELFVEKLNVDTVQFILVSDLLFCTVLFSLLAVLPTHTLISAVCLVSLLISICMIAGVTIHAMLASFLVVFHGIYFVVIYMLCRCWTENKDLLGAIDSINSIMEEVIRIKDVCGSGQSGESADGQSRRDLEGIGKNNSFAVGLESEVNEICGRLIGYPSQLETVSIVGMGGIGKTTLARQVHDDPNIDHHFDICAWVTVSQNYTLRRIMLGLLDSAKIHTQGILQNHCDDELDQKLGEHLYKNLMSRRYLIVMDDMWDTEIWDFVRMFFPENDNGSRVLLTSRLSEVASYANPYTPPLQMRFLNDGESWRLLGEKVFGGECCPPGLQGIGRTIARNCRGLPLAIVVVGGVLYNEDRTVEEWERVSNNLSSILGEDDEQCLGILSLSYHHLPHHLKPCFLYMGAFCEGEEIHVDRIFNLWGAEGFLKPRKDKFLEEVAEEYLEDLIQRSLVLVGEWRCNGKIKTCKIHDLIRDVCWRNAKQEEFLHFADLAADDLPVMKMLGVSLFSSSYSSSSVPNFYSPPPVILSRLPRSCMAHTVIYDSDGGFFFHDLKRIYLGFRLIRVLDIVRNITLNGFPDEILELVHLRYLGLPVNYLCSSISLLWNLQTIVIHGRDRDGSLWIPVGMWSMRNLRHLYFKGDLLPHPPAWNTIVLENLQTLVGISNFRCTKGILKSIPNLKKLGIIFHNTVDWSKHKLASVVNLHQLESLKITVPLLWNPLSHMRPPKLAFPHKLTKLSLRGCRMPWESMRVVGALPNLQVLKLRNHACEGQVWKPVEGEFCQLMFLLLEGMNLEQWRANEAHYPRLQRLILRNMFNLEEIPCDMGEIPTLEMMELVDCLPSAVASAKQIQEEQQSMGNECLKIRIETSVGPDMGGWIWRERERVKIAGRTQVKQKLSCEYRRSAGLTFLSFKCHV